MHSKIANTTTLLAVGSLCLLALAAPAHAHGLRNSGDAGAGAAGAHRRLGRTANCCPKQGCHSGVHSYYGHDGCGPGQYQTSRPACAGEFLGIKSKHSCSLCASCPANTYQPGENGGCSQATSCRPCGFGWWSAPGATKCTRCTVENSNEGYGYSGCEGWKRERARAAKATFDAKLDAKKVEELAKKVQELEAQLKALKAQKGCDAEKEEIAADAYARAMSRDLAAKDAQLAAQNKQLVALRERLSTKGKEATKLLEELRETLCALTGEACD